MRTSIQAAMSAINLYSEYFLGLIISLTIARNLSTDDYGIYSSVIWLAGLITLAINSGLAINVTKFVAEFSKREPDALPAILAYFWRIQHIRVFIVLIVAIGFLFLNANNSNIDRWILVILIICAVVKADYMFRMAVLKGIKRYDILAKTSVISNPFNITAVLLCAYFDASLNNFILVYCSACIVYGVSARLYNNQLPEKYWNTDVIMQHKKRILTQMLSATGIVFFGTLIFKQSQVIVLEQSNFFSEAGFFNIGFLLSTAAITLIPGIYQEILLPKITDAVQDGDVTAQVQQAERYLIMLTSLVAIPVVIYADVIIDTLYGARYHNAVFCLQIMIVLKAIMTLNQGANLTLISNDKQVDMVKINVAMFVIAVLLSVFFVPSFGLNGALFVYGVLVITLLISYSLLARSCNYKIISLEQMIRIILPAILAAIPVLIINLFLTGVLSAVIGTSIFIIIYLNLLIIFKGYDKSVLFILKQLEPKIPNMSKRYIHWIINKLK